MTAVLVVGYVLVAALAVVLMQRGLRTYIENALDRRRARRRIAPQRVTALLQHADQEDWWTRWQHEAATAHEPPDPDGSP